MLCGKKPLEKTKEPTKTRTDDDQYICRHMVSLGHKELNIFIVAIYQDDTWLLVVAATCTLLRLLFLVYQAWNP